MMGWLPAPVRGADREGIPAWPVCGLRRELVEAADDIILSKMVARYGRVDLLCVDELGYMQLDRKVTSPTPERHTKPFHGRDRRRSGGSQLLPQTHRDQARHVVFEGPNRPDEVSGLHALGSDV